MKISLRLLFGLALGLALGYALTLLARPAPSRPVRRRTPLGRLDEAPEREPVP